MRRALYWSSYLVLNMHTLTVTSRKHLVVPGEKGLHGDNVPQGETARRTPLTV